MTEEIKNTLIKEAFFRAIHEKTGSENNPETDEQLIKELEEASIITKKDDFSNTQKEEGRTEEPEEEIKGILFEEKIEEILEKIKEHKIKEGEIVERGLMMPIEFWGHNRVERPTGNLFFDSEKKIPVYIEFPRFFESVVGNYINKKKEVPVEYLRFFRKKDERPYLIGRYDFQYFSEEKGKKITEKIINKEIEDYGKFIKSQIDKGKITQEKVDQVDVEREVLYFLVPDGQLSAWERKVKGELNNEEIKDLILKKKNLKDIIREEKTKKVGQKRIEIDDDQFIDSDRREEQEEESQSGFDLYERRKEEERIKRDQKIKEKMKKWENLSLSELEELEIPGDDEIGQEAKRRRIKMIEQRIEELKKQQEEDDKELENLLSQIKKLKEQIIRQEPDL